MGGVRRGSSLTGLGDRAQHEETQILWYIRRVGPLVEITVSSSLSRRQGPDSDKDPRVLPFLSAPIHYFGKTVSFVQDGHGGLFVLCIR